MTFIWFWLAKPIAEIALLILVAVSAFIFSLVRAYIQMKRFTKVNKIRWRKNPRETGLRGVVPGPRGSTGMLGGEAVARVYPHGGRLGVRPSGWHFVIRAEGVVHNSCTEPLYATEDEAKLGCQAYYEDALSRIGGTP